MTAFLDRCSELFKLIPGKHSFHVYVIPSKPITCSPVILALRTWTWTLAHKLILVSNDQFSPSSSSSENSPLTSESAKPVFIYGLEILEYVARPPLTLSSSIQTRHIIYVSKVDSSGFWHSTGGPSLVRLILRSYLETAISKAEIHVFARSGPQYLFPQSAKNPNKHGLDHRELIRWWKRTLDEAFVDEPGVHGWWLVPNIESEREIIGPLSNSSIHWWSYGHPYPPLDNAAEVIPRFPDDAKRRVFETFEKEKDMNVSLFWELIGIAEECGGNRVAGFFVVRRAGSGEEERKNDESEKNDEEKKDTLEKVESFGLDMEKWTECWNELMSGSFNTWSGAVEATRKVQEMIRKAEVPGPVDIVVNGIAEDTETLKAKDNTNEVNVLDSVAIKRKERSDETQREVKLNVLGANLIKRKKQA